MTIARGRAEPAVRGARWCLSLPPEHHAPPRRAPKVCSQNDARAAPPCPSTPAMGSGRDKRKKLAKRSGKESEAASGAAKTDRKTDKNQAKLERRMAKASAADDIDAILASIKLMDAKKTEVEVTDDVPKPTPRCNCSFTPTLAQKPAEIVMFGGEAVDSSGKTRVYGDLFRYDCDKNRWRWSRAPTTPPPRSAHQAVAHGGYVYVFGGEFTSPNQERFHHYRDLWRLNLEENTWESLPSKTGPGPRVARHDASSSTPAANHSCCSGAFTTPVRRLNTTTTCGSSCWRR